MLADLGVISTLPPTAWGFRRKITQRKKTKCKFLSELTEKAVLELNWKLPCCLAALT